MSRMEKVAAGKVGEELGLRFISGRLLALRVVDSVGYTQVSPFMRQLPQAGLVSLHLIFLCLHEKQPPRLFLCDRRVRLGASVRVLACLLSPRPPLLPGVVGSEGNSQEEWEVRSGEVVSLVMLSSKVMLEGYVECTIQNWWGPGISGCCDPFVVRELPSVKRLLGRWTGISPQVGTSDRMGPRGSKGSGMLGQA
jgi:hypothetical protein